MVHRAHPRPPAEYVFGNRTHDSADTDGSIEAGER